MEKSNERTKEKKKQGPKPGKVIRVDKEAWSLLARKKRPNETISALIRRVLGIPPRKNPTGRIVRRFFILPESRVILDCSTIEEARGRALLHFLRKGEEPSEKPIEVREVI